MNNNSYHIYIYYVPGAVAGALHKLMVHLTSALKSHPYFIEEETKAQRS